MLPPPPISPRTSTPFSFTSLFRSPNSSRPNLLLHIVLDLTPSSSSAEITSAARTLQWLVPQLSQADRLAFSIQTDQGLQSLFSFVPPTAIANKSFEPILTESLRTSVALNSSSFADTLSAAARS